MNTLNQNVIVKLSDREHILMRPSMYIGGVNAIENYEYLYNGNIIEYKQIKYIPGLLKIINEIIDNSVDVAIKNNFKIGTKISVKMTEDSVEVQDDGTGIPNIKNKDGELMPVIAWGSARAGSNFNDDNRTQIGMNGIGSFATNCFSTEFIGISDDGEKECVYTWKNNAKDLNSIQEKKSKKSGVTVKFKPDFQRFNIQKLDETYFSLIYQRLINLKLSYPEIDFKFNGKLIKIDSFKKYVKLFGFEEPVTIETDNYSYAILSNASDEFRQFSYVNGLKISDSGTHIEYFINNVVNKVRERLIKKYKSIKPADIKNKLFVIAFLKNFPNAKFSSQSKEKITNSNAEISEYLGDIDFQVIANKILRNQQLIDPITEIYKLKEEFKRRQELKSLDKPKKIKNEKYLPAIENNKYLLIVEGDCLDFDTDVLMSDFSTKKIRNLQINDQIIGSNFAKTKVIAKSSLLKECLKLETECGDIICSKEHRFKVYDVKEKTFKFVEAQKIARYKDKYLLLKSKINDETNALKVTLVGKNRNRYYCYTDNNQYLAFTDNDVFTILRDNNFMQCNAIDIKVNDVLILSKDYINE